MNCEAITSLVEGGGNGKPTSHHELGTTSVLKKMERRVKVWSGLHWAELLLLAQLAVRAHLSILGQPWGLTSTFSLHAVF